MLRDHELFVGRYHKYFHAAVGPRDERLLRYVRFYIQFGPKPLEFFSDPRADPRRIFTNPRGEYEGIEPAKGSRQHPGVKTNTIYEIVDGQDRARLVARLQARAYRC